MRAEFNCIAEYDPEFDFISFTRPGIKATGSIRAGSFIIDTNRDGLVGLEIEGASEVLEPLVGFNVEPEKISNAKIGFIERKDLVMLFITLTYQDQVITKEVILPKITPIPILA